MEEKKKQAITPKLQLAPSLKKSISEERKKAKPYRKLIFLIGFQNTGKDSVFKMLKDVSIEPVVRVSFADALKSEVYPTLGKEYDPENDDREWKDKHRPQIIQYGEGQKQKNGQNYWVKRALDDLLAKKYDRKVDTPHIVVTDCRRIEEMMWFKHFKLGHYKELEEALKIYEPVMFVVHREKAEEDSDYLTHIALEYAAETRMFSRMIKNYKGLKELKKDVEDLYMRSIR